LLFTSKLDNSNSFPHPLSPEKEQEFIKKFKESGDLSARDTLIKYNLRLVAYIAKKYTNYPDQDELISVGTYGLIKAITSFQPEKNTQLATYASKCIENEILMAMRSYKKRQGNISIYETIGMDKDGNEMMLIDLLSVDEESVYSRMECELMRDSIKKIIVKYLNEREQNIINYRFGLKGSVIMTQQEVADILKISRSYVSRIEKTALTKLKCAIRKENLQI